MLVLQRQRLIRLRRKYPEIVQIERFDSVSAALTDGKKAKMEVEAASLSAGLSVRGTGAGCSSAGVQNLGRVQARMRALAG